VSYTFSRDDHHRVSRVVRRVESLPLDTSAPRRGPRAGGVADRLAVAQLNGTLSGGGTATIDNFRVLNGATPDPLPTSALNTYALSGADNTYGLLRLVGTDWVLVALMTGSGGSDETKVVRIKSDTGSPTIGDEAIATATLSGIGKVYKAVLLSWSGSAWTEGTNVRVLVSPAKAGATPVANHNQVLLGQLVGTRTESSVDYALYGATEAGSGGGVIPCWVTSGCAKATRSGGTVTMNTVTVRLQKKGSTDAELVNEAADATAYWDNLNEPVTIGSGKSRQGAVAKLPSGIYLLLYVDCKDITYTPS
jgi:hypothetical protein